MPEILIQEQQSWGILGILLGCQWGHNYLHNTIKTLFVSFTFLLFHTCSDSGAKAVVGEKLPGL